MKGSGSNFALGAALGFGGIMMFVLSRKTKWQQANKEIKKTARGFRKSGKLLAFRAGSA